jgi:hypothetical protein
MSAHRPHPADVADVARETSRGSAADRRARHAAYMREWRKSHPSNGATPRRDPRDPRDNGARHLAGYVVAWVLSNPHAPHASADVKVCSAPLPEEHMLAAGPFDTAAEANVALLDLARGWER